MMIRIFFLMAATTFFTSWVSLVIYDHYHGGGFSSWLQWHTKQLEETFPWWILMAWAMGHPHMI